MNPFALPIRGALTTSAPHPPYRAIHFPQTQTPQSHFPENPSQTAQAANKKKSNYTKFSASKLSRFEEKNGQKTGQQQEQAGLWSLSSLYFQEVEGELIHGFILTESWRLIQQEIPGIPSPHYRPQPFQGDNPKML